MCTTRAENHRHYLCVGDDVNLQMKGHKTHLLTLQPFGFIACLYMLSCLFGRKWCDQHTQVRPIVPRYAIDGDLRAEVIEGLRF